MQLFFWFAICLVFIFYTQDSKAHKEKCSGITVKGKFHKKEVLVSGVNRPYQLTLYEHKLYFSYNIGEEDDEDKFEIGYINLNDKHKTVTPVSAVKNGFATTLDEDNKLLYLGGSDGVYVENLEKSGEIKQVIEGHDIWDMFFKDHLYFIEYQTQRLRKKVHNDSELVEHIKEKLYQFAIDGNEDIFITTKRGLREIKNGTTGRIPYDDGPNSFRAIEVDRKGVAHFCGKSSIFVANKENHTLEEIAHVKNIFGLTFDKDNNIIYSDPHEIVKLLPEDCK